MERNESAEGISPKEHLLWMRDAFSDDIPAEVIHSNSPNNKFKVRRNWFYGLVQNLELWVLGDRLVDDPGIDEEVGKFITHVRSDEFTKKPLTEAEDIEWANKVINMVVDKMQN